MTAFAQGGTLIVGGAEVSYTDQATFSAFTAPVDNDPEPSLAAATWRCTCGHPLYRHSVRKDGQPAKSSWHVCQVDGCACECGHSEAEVAAGEPPWQW